MKTPFKLRVLEERRNPIQFWTTGILEEGHPKIGQREVSMEFLRRHGKDVTGSVLNCGSNNDLYGYRRFFPKCSRYRLLDLKTPEQWPGKPRDIVIADVQNMPQIPTDSEDCIIAYWLLYFLSNHRSALAEFRRVLKPNGILLASFIGNALKFNPNVLRRWTPIEALEALEPFYEVEEVELYCETRDMWTSMELSPPKGTERHFIMGATAIGWKGLKRTLVCARAISGV